LKENVRDFAAEKMDDRGLVDLTNFTVNLKSTARLKTGKNTWRSTTVFHSLVRSFGWQQVLSEVINGLRQKILLYRYRQIYQPGRLLESMQIIVSFKKPSGRETQKQPKNS